MHKLYYISQGKNQKEHLHNIENVCKAGIKLVQLRMKKVEQSEYEETAFKAMEICEKYGAIFIVNDNVIIAKKVNANGVHLGKKDMSPTEARKVLGSEKIIGGTANTLVDCERLINEKVDYIGLGPHKFTTTKKNLSPTLQIEDYFEMLTKLNAKIPIYGIGGILENDFKPLINSGLYGLAISGLISGKQVEDIKIIVMRFNTIEKLVL